MGCGPSFGRSGCSSRDTVQKLGKCQAYEIGRFFEVLDGFDELGRGFLVIVQEEEISITSQCCQPQQEPDEPVEYKESQLRVGEWEGWDGDLPSSECADGLFEFWGGRRRGCQGCWRRQVW